MHEIDEAMSSLGSNSTPEQRLEVIWRAYEETANRTIERPPTVEQRRLVHDWLIGLRREGSEPMLWLRDTHLWAPISLSMREKVSHLAQGRCTACEVIVEADGSLPLHVMFPVDIDPWSAQSVTNRTAVKGAVHDELVRRGTRVPYAGTLCLTIVSLIAHARPGRMDSDNLVKGLLDAMHGVLYDNDRQIQCLTSRRIEYAGGSGMYSVSARAVHPWDADVVYDNPAAPKILIGERIARRVL